MPFKNSITEDLKIIQLVLDQLQERLLLLDKNFKIVKKSKGAIEFISLFYSSTERDFFEYFPELKSKELDNFCSDSTQNTFEIERFLPEEISTEDKKIIINILRKNANV